MSPVHFSVSVQSSYRQCFCMNIRIWTIQIHQQLLLSFRGIHPIENGLSSFTIGCRNVGIDMKRSGVNLVWGRGGRRWMRRCWEEEGKERTLSSTYIKEGSHGGSDVDDMYGIIRDIYGGVIIQGIQENLLEGRLRIYIHTNTVEIKPPDCPTNASSFFQNQWSHKTIPPIYRTCFCALKLLSVSPSNKKVTSTVRCP